jgi:hypothetical protein
VAIAGEQAVSERNSARFDAIRKMPSDGLVVLENMAVSVNNLHLICHRSPPWQNRLGFNPWQFCYSVVFIQRLS